MFLWFETCENVFSKINIYLNNIEVQNNESLFKNAFYNDIFIYAKLGHFLSYFMPLAKNRTLDAKACQQSYDDMK